MELDQQTLDQLGYKPDTLSRKIPRNRQYTYSEYVGGMSTFRRVGRSKRWTPAFADNEAQLKSVIIHAAIGYAFRSKPPKEIIKELAYWDGVTKTRTAAAQELVETSEHWSRCQQYLAAQTACGGFMALHSAIAYRAWRMHWPDRDVANSLAMQTRTVGVVLRKLIRIANELGYPTYPSKITKRDRAAWEDIVALWQSGLTTVQIAKKLNCCPQRTRFILRKFGLYTCRRYPNQFNNARGNPDDIVALWNQGLGTVQIASRLGTSSARVARYLKKLGLYVLRSNSRSSIAIRNQSRQ